MAPSSGPLLGIVFPCALIDCPTMIIPTIFSYDIWMFSSVFMLNPRRIKLHVSTLLFFYELIMGLIQHALTFLCTICKAVAGASFAALSHMLFWFGFRLHSCFCMGRG
ncbi:unknown protein [Desulfotalea psychrophila LSv54]|uniref:Uncharacterized protein n=1 Tax=Desulfotalea psychrophila (strain LSv54 / DSM 12343) TaxID=177439 RepID=Q6AM66_DESPS|nr:unknown protein [Desulfotalea psychrophila LSv54]